MILERLEIGHFRCVEDCVVSLDPYTAIIGPNGVGKSTVLEALRFLLTPEASVTEADFNACTPERPISVTGRFKNLNRMEIDSWHDLVEVDGAVSLTRYAERSANNSFLLTYRGVILRHAEFDALYADYAGNKNIFRSKYNEFRKAKPTYELANANLADDMMASLRAYEIGNPGNCELRDTVLDAKLWSEMIRDAFRIVHVPAVSPIAETIEGTRAPLDRLIDQMLWRKGLMKPEFIELQKRLLEEYRAIFPSDDPTDFKQAGKLINDAFERFAPGSSVQFGWKPSTAVKLAPPGYRTLVTEDGVSGDVERKGNGVQRALVVAVLNAMAEREAAPHPVEETTKLGPTMILLVEEPELYQHPTRARHFARSLMALARIEDDAPRMQVVVTTHSPHFVTIDRFASIRLMRRDKTEARIAPRRVLSQTTLSSIWETLRLAKGLEAGTKDAMLAQNRLTYALDETVREGFFADAIVLVEGASDRAALTAGFAARGKDLDALGIAVIGHGGAGELDKLWVIFRSLQIPTFMIFDGDKGGKTDESKRNRRLLGLVGAEAQDFPPTTVAASYTVFESNREAILKAEFGPDYNRLMDERCRNSDYARDQGEKTVGIVTEVYRELTALGKTSKTLLAICDAVERLIS